MQKVKRKKKYLELTLEENAADSLAIAIDWYFSDKPTAWKQTILNVAQAIELFLKVALAQHDPKLVYKNERSTFTINAFEAIERLAKLGVELTDDEKNNIEALRESRNAIEHLELTVSQNDVDLTLVRAMRFLDEFLPGLDIEIGTLIDQGRFLEFKHAIQGAADWLAAAEAKASDKISWHDVRKGAYGEVAFCPECFSQTVAVGDGVGALICEHCRETWDTVEKCIKCGTPVLGGIHEDDVGMCGDCWGYIGNRE